MNYRFKIADLMALVVFVAVPAAVVHYESDLWMVLPPILYATVVCVATVGARLRPGTRGSAWLGFALFGWTCMGFGLIVLFTDGLDEDWCLFLPGFGLYGSALTAYFARRVAPLKAPPAAVGDPDLG